MTSAEKLDGTPSQLLMTGLPACHNSRTPFGRAIGVLLRFKKGSEADPASYGGRCQAPSPARCYLQRTCPLSVLLHLLLLEIYRRVFPTGEHTLGMYVGILAKL